MSVASIIISGALGFIVLVLISYWIYLVYQLSRTFKEITSVERQMSVMPTNLEKKDNDQLKQSSHSSDNSGKFTKLGTSKSAKSKSSTKSKETIIEQKSKKYSDKSKKCSDKSKKCSEESIRSSKSGDSLRQPAGKDIHYELTLREIIPFHIKGTKAKIERKPDKENFCEMINKIATFMKNYMEQAGRLPVTSDSLPGFLYQRLQTHPPAIGVTLDSIMDDVKKLIVPTMTHHKHPRYLASNLLTRSVPDIVGELIAVHIGAPGLTYDASPAVAEMQVAMLNWAGRALGIPEKFLFYANSETSQGGASFQESIGESTLCVLMVARTHSTNQQFIAMSRIQRGEHYLFAEATAQKFEEHHNIYGRLCVYASSEVHPTLEKQCRLSMMRLRRIQALAKNGYGITAHQVKKKIKKDIAMGRIPSCIIVTLGTDGVMANDELGKICRLGIKYNCWVHVMAHNVSAFWMEPKFRPSSEDLIHANSIMGRLPYHANNMVIVWTRNQNLWKDGFKIFPQYLKPSKSYAIDERDWAIHLNRRFRGIKVWLNYRMIGLKRMREHANQICRLTAYLEKKIAAHENMRIFGTRVFNSFCFQYYEQGLSMQNIAKYTRLLGIYINESHRLYLKICNVVGSLVLSVSVSYEGTTQHSLDELYNDLDELVKQFRLHKDDATLLKFPPELSAPPSEVAVSVTPLRTAQASSPKNPATLSITSSR